MASRITGSSYLAFRSGSHMLPAAQPELVLAEVVALAARQWAAQVCANSSSWLLAGMG